MQLGLLLFDTADSHDLNSIFDYATRADQLQYSRLWFGEHYDGSKVKLWCNPEPFLPVVLGLTENLNVGCAGIILRLHNPYRVAQSFKLMHGMFPGRVDLGLASGLTTDLPMQYLTKQTAEQVKDMDYDALLAEFFSFYQQEEAWAERGLHVPPYKFPSPQAWLLSLSNGRLKDALQYRTNYSRSIFHSFAKKDYWKEDLLRFKEDYYQRYGVLPKINLAFAGIPAPSREAAEKIYAATPFARKNSNYLANILGSPQTFLETLADWEEKYGIDEFIFMDLSPTMQQRQENLYVLSEITQTLSTTASVTV